MTTADTERPCLSVKHCTCLARSDLTDSGLQELQDQAAQATFGAEVFLTGLARNASITEHQA